MAGLLGGCLPHGDIARLAAGEAMVATRAAIGGDRQNFAEEALDHSTPVRPPNLLAATAGTRVTECHKSPALWGIHEAGKRK